MNNTSHEFSTFIELLRWRATHQSAQRGYTFLVDGETEEIHLTYAELDQQARTIGAMLQHVTTMGERALLLYPPGLEYMAAFFGCLYAGVIAVPTYPPRLNRPTPRLRAIVRDAQAKVVLTTTAILSNVERLLAHEPDLKACKWLATDDVDSDLASVWQAPAVGSDTLAFLQYTSGSTGTPKGVMVSHGNLLHNSAQIRKSFQHTPNSRGVIWLPFYHDMGLLGGVLQPLYAGGLVTLMSPVAFLQRPFRWLQAISHYKATTSGGPNFAYDLCVQKITPNERATLDLSSWEVAFNGAEPIRAETLERFAATFEPCGFRWKAFFPCYGMAESTLLVSGGPKTASPVVIQVDSAALRSNRVLEASASTTQTVVGCGQTSLEQKIVIVDPESLIQCPTDQVGEIWVSGRSVAQGYWNQPQETEQTFNAYLAAEGLGEDQRSGPFLRTGDLGILKDGELFVTGRLKDLIIIRGHNHYPQDIELTVEKSHPGLRLGCGAAFSVFVSGEERLVVAQEVKRTYRRKLAERVDEVVGAIRQAVAEQHELEVYAVLLLRTGSIPKTSSGKIQRHACRAGFLADNLKLIGRSILISDEGEAPLNESSLTRAVLLATKPTQRQEMLAAYLRQQLAKALGVSASRLGLDQPFTTLGIDSLKALELKGRIENDLEVDMPLESFIERPTIAQLTSALLDKLTVAPVTFEEPDSAEQLLSRLDQLSDEEVDLWLKQLTAPGGIK